MISDYADRFFGTDVADIDPLTDALIRLEEERQVRRLILIPSESYVPSPVRQALGSVFTNVYAEGYPPSQMVGDDEDLLADLSQQLAYYRRYADRRFYKGADYVHFIETLAQRRAAECFANNLIPADEIYINVQPLSGSAANLAAYDALMEPGDTLMGMDLYQGGHLTHGSEFNVSGKRYKVVSYGVSDRDHRLDYDRILELAQEYRPRVIVAGYTSFPWAPDFSAFRRIADEVGAYLLADIAHPAGMVIAGEYPNPVGVADVVTFTTHKTICGPRGACILTTDADLAKRIDHAVFPGLQGGPHTNKFAAMCVAFEIARSDAFCDLQRRTIENAQALAKGLTDRGLALAYGGTDTHLLLLDLNSIRHPNGQPLYGEVVARILELVGIVVNKNTIPGDEITALAMGIRMGTPWVTERGLGPKEIDRLADCIAQIVQDIVPFSYQGLSGTLPRGKVHLEVLEGIKQEVDALACASKVEIERLGTAYPHFCLLPSEVEAPRLVLTGDDALEPSMLKEDTVLVDLSDLSLVRVTGWRSRPFLQDLLTVDVGALGEGEGMRGLMLDMDGAVVDDVTLWRCENDERGRDCYLMFLHPENASYALSWMRALSDGYVLFDDEDVWRKVRGPAKVELASELVGEEGILAFAVRGPDAPKAVGEALDGVSLTELAPFALTQLEYRGSALHVAREGYTPDDTWYMLFGPASGIRRAWQALIDARLRPAQASETRQALRDAAGLPKRWLDKGQVLACLVRRPEMIDRHKPYFVGQRSLVEPPDTVESAPFDWSEPTGAPLRRTPLYEEHLALNAKMVPFAGWEMPVWYTRVSDEHQAVREAAGLFDVAHMGTLEVSGPHAADFLDLVTVNYVRWLQDGESQYSALLDARGQILDDILVYRRTQDRYLVVVNAANFDKDWAWLNAVNEGRVSIDDARPWVRVPQPAVMRDLRDPSSEADQRIDLALQGPNARRVLMDCIDDAGLRRRLARLQRTEFLEGRVADMELLISRTGYTGESMGFELYVHPNRAAELWQLLLTKGAAHGLVPCGLAARDSLRIEAGLPLYGHELGGPLGISQTEAGFGAYVKYHKPFFVGRTPYKAYNDLSERRVVRFTVFEQGVRAIRGGEHTEPVVNRRGRVIGTVTSCALVGDEQIGMALVEGRYAEPGTELYIYPEARRAVAKLPQAFEQGDTVALPIAAEVVSRFPRN
jgi:glycine cleavage system T protein